MSPVLLVVGGCSSAVYRRDCLIQTAARHPVALVTDQEPTWQRDFIVDHEVANLRDHQAVQAAAERLSRRRPIRGVLTWDEYLLVQTARLAQTLDVPGNRDWAMHACRNKAAAREKFDQLDVPSAASIPVLTLAEARRAAVGIGYPVVLKPAAHAGSVGVVHVAGPAELPKSWRYVAEAAKTQGAEGTGALVEEYLDGAEISVECVTENGRTTAVAVAHKDLTALPHFEEIGHTVTADDPLLDEVAPLASQALAALGVTHGVSHVEMRLTASGPKIVEVNARLAGDMIPRLVQLATGIDLVAAAADLALGHSPQLKPSRSRSAAVRIFYPPSAGNLTQCRLDPAVARSPWIDRVSWQAAIGEAVAPPPHTAIHASRVGFAIVTGRSPAQTRRCLDRVEDRLVITVAPLPRDERSAA
ncbi:ATP-grasp domain-containing protein [Streptomyces sp. NPDC001633]|uniref:ATP-grasp domain-containing protein n=1 Tax=Streptomyces sp. NPDC001633 TaxID=3364595 RepID=UPI0036C58782